MNSSHYFLQQVKRQLAIIPSYYFDNILYPLSRRRMKKVAVFQRQKGTRIENFL